MQIALSQALSALICLVLSFTSILGINVNKGITEPTIPTEQTKEAIVEYYNELLDTTKMKKYVLVSEVNTFSSEITPEPGSPASIEFEGIEIPLAESYTDTLNYFDDELFCHGTSLSTGLSLSMVIPPSSLDSQGVLSAEIVEYGSDYVLTIILEPETCTNDTPLVYNPQCVFNLSFSSILTLDLFPFEGSINYPDTTLTATIGSDGVLKELVADVNYDGCISADIQSDEISFTGSYSINGYDTQIFSFSYDF